MAYCNPVSLCPLFFCQIEKRSIQNTQLHLGYIIDQRLQCPVSLKVELICPMFPNLEDKLRTRPFQKQLKCKRVCTVPGLVRRPQEAGGYGGGKLSRHTSKTKIDVTNLAVLLRACSGCLMTIFELFKPVHHPSLKQKLSSYVALSLCQERLLIFQVLSITID